MRPWSKPLFALAVLLGGCAVSSSPTDERSGVSAGARDGLKLASWNLEHLAERDGEGCRPRTERDYAELRRHAAVLDADVIAFQEVESVGAAERVFTPDEYRIVIEERRAAGARGGCYGAPGRRLRAQKVGFAIRRGLSFTRHPDLSELGLGNADLRTGVDVTIRAGQPLRLLAVHLKSGCNSGRAPSDRDCDTLFRQVPVLER
jgi:endonuclease/exonuclease/phosphatase family metal-dependent hydrolase